MLASLLDFINDMGTLLLPSIPVFRINPQGQVAKTSSHPVQKKKKRKPKLEKENNCKQSPNQTSSRTVLYKSQKPGKSFLEKRSLRFIRKELFFEKSSPWETAVSFLTSDCFKDVFTRVVCRGHKGGKGGYEQKSNHESKEVWGGQNWCKAFTVSFPFFNIYTNLIFFSKGVFCSSDRKGEKSQPAKYLLMSSLNAKNCPQRQ